MANRMLALTSPHMGGDDVRALQKAVHERLAAVQLLGCAVDGDYGPATSKAVQRAKYVTGFPLGAVRSHKCSATAQRYLEEPKKRPVSYRLREGWRRKHEWAVVRLWRKRQRAERRGPHAAIEWAQKQAGTVEHPPDSNRGPGISAWERFWGFGAEPWCGIFAGFAVKEHGGVAGLTSRVASCPLIVDDAAAGRNGFAGIVSEPRPGDFVVYDFGVGWYQHTGLYCGGGVTIEGNTSSGSGGSQDNGGGVFVRRRNFGAIPRVRFCRPRY